MEEYIIKEYDNMFFILIRGWMYCVSFREDFMGDKMWCTYCSNGETTVLYGRLFSDKERAKNYIIEHSKYMEEGKLTKKDFENHLIKRSLL